MTNSRAGTVEARQRAKLSPEIGGTVAEIPFREGDRIERGALLLRLEDSLQRARLEVAQGDLEAAAYTDYCHLTPDGNRVLAEAAAPQIAEMLRARIVRGQHLARTTR